MILSPAMGRAALMAQLIVCNPWALACVIQDQVEVEPSIAFATSSRGLGETVML